jgi:transforming growth factor-beta-induced protein
MTAQVLDSDIMLKNALLNIFLLVAATAATTGRPSIVEAAVATPSLSTLVSVLTMREYSGILAALSGRGPFTVFAPTNEAFARAGINVNDVAAVTEVLKYHVISGAITSSVLSSSQSVTTLQGEKVLVTKTSSGRVFVNNDALVVTADVIASNGVVHLIDEVLITPSPTNQRRPSIVEAAIATPSLSTLVSVLTMRQYSSILAALSGTGPFTVFAPTNEAFARAGINVYDVATVTAVLKYHVISGAITSSALAPSQSVTTLQGEKVSVVKTSDGRVFVNNNAQVVVADVVATNGVVHLIDEVLMPPSLLYSNSAATLRPSIVEAAIATPSLSTLVSVLTMREYSGILTALSGTGAFTVFAPTNEAFARAGINVYDVATVTEVLKYHVLMGAVTSSALSSSQSVTTLQGEKVSVTKTSDGRVFVNGGAQVVVADVVATNGVVHLIDEVLMPSSFLNPDTEINAAIAEGAGWYDSGDREGCFSRYLVTALALRSSLRTDAVVQAQREGSAGDYSNGAWTLRREFDRFLGSGSSTSGRPSIVEAAIATPSLSTLLSVLTMREYSGILTALSGTGPFTVFAPTNEAFARAGINVYDVATVTEVLKYHVLMGAVTSSALSSSQSVATLQGEKVTVTKYGGRVFVNDRAMVVVADVVATNGVVHIIDEVLMPPSLQYSKGTYLDIRQELNDAIDAGSAMFNRGDQRGCYELYLRTAERVLTALNSNSASRRQLALAINQGKDSAYYGDYSEAAFTLRYAFDDILDSQGYSY